MVFTRGEKRYEVGMKRILGLWIVGAVLGAMPLGVCGAELRDWRASSGDVMAARLVKVRDGKVELQTRDGRTVTLERGLLSQADQNYLEEYGGAPAMPDGDVANIAKATKFDPKSVVKREAKLSLDELDLEFQIFETPHFLILERGSSRARDTAENAERLWNEMAFIHPDFARKWRKHKMAIFMVEDESDYLALGEWYAKQVAALGDEKTPQFAQMARNIELTWPKSSAGTIAINRDIAEANDLMRHARVFWIRDASQWRGTYVAFRTHCLAGDLLDVQVDGVARYADAGWFAVSTGHSFFREIELCDQVQTRLLDADSYSSDEVVEAGGFDDGRKWAKVAKELVRRGKLDPKLKDMYGLAVANLTPEYCVMAYAFSQFLQSTVQRRAAYAKLMELVQTSSQMPVPEELAKIYGYESVEKMEEGWVEFMKSATFR